MPSNKKVFSQKEFEYVSERISDFEEVIRTIDFNDGMEKKLRKYIQRSFVNVVSLSSEESSGGDFFSFVNFCRKLNVHFS